MKEFNRRVRILVRVAERDAAVAEAIFGDHGWPTTPCESRRATHSVDVLLYGAKSAARDAGVRLLLAAVESHVPVKILQARLVDSRVPPTTTYRVRRSDLGWIGGVLNPLHWLITADPDEKMITVRRWAAVSPLAPENLENFSLHERIGARPPKGTLRRPQQYLMAAFAVILVLGSMALGYYVAERRAPWPLLALLLLAYPLGLMTSNNRQRRILVHWALGLPFPLAAAAIGAGMALGPHPGVNLWISFPLAAVSLLVLSGIQHLWVAGLRHVAGKFVALVGVLGVVAKFFADSMTVHVYTDWLGIPPGATLRSSASQTILMWPVLGTTTAAILILAGCMGWYRYFTPDITKMFGWWIMLLLVGVAIPLQGFLVGNQQLDKRTIKIQSGHESPASVGIISTPVCAKPVKPNIKVDGLDLDFTQVLQHVATSDGRVWLWDVTNPVDRIARVGVVSPSDVTLRRVTNQMSCA